MKRTLIPVGVAAIFTSLGLAAYAQGHARHNHATCTQEEGKPCPADAKALHQHDGKASRMPGGMSGMQGMKEMHGKHADMEKHHAQKAQMHARMHAAQGTPDKDSAEPEHKH